MIGYDLLLSTLSNRSFVFVKITYVGCIFLCTVVLSELLVAYLGSWLNRTNDVSSTQVCAVLVEVGIKIKERQEREKNRT